MTTYEAAQEVMIALAAIRLMLSRIAPRIELFGHSLGHGASMDKSPVVRVLLAEDLFRATAITAVVGSGPSLRIW